MSQDLLTLSEDLSFCNLLDLESSLSHPPPQPPKQSLPTKDADLKTSILLWPNRRNLLFLAFYVSFPELLPAPIILNYDSAEMSTASYCLRKHHGANGENPE